MKEILDYNKQYESQYMKDGINSEVKIKSQYSKLTGNKVEQCGFYVSITHPFLGASPDGLIDTDGVIEVKKIHPHAGETLVEALLRLHIIKETNGCLTLNTSHSYNYQVQLQLFCTGRKWADFVASDGETLFIKNIPYDKEFMDSNLPRLQQFYYDVLLLELAYPRVKNGIDRIGKLGINYSTLRNRHE